jgi:nucleoside 2-deoxyribosyltransferase
VTCGAETRDVHVPEPESPDGPTGPARRPNWPASTTGKRFTADFVIPHVACAHRGQVDNELLARSVAASSAKHVIGGEEVNWRRDSNGVSNSEFRVQGPTGSDPCASAEPLPQSSPIRVFVAMSFHEEEEPALVDYFQAMLRAAEKAHREFTLIRLDHVEGDYAIIDRIYKEIDAAHLVIADLTLSSPNVYLEIGYARGRRKHVIQTCRSDTQLEFDVRGGRTLMYRNATTLEHKLLRELDAL